MRTRGAILALAIIGFAGGAGAAGGKSPSDVFTLKVPAPGHITFMVLQVDGGTRFAHGAVPRPQLVAPAKLPKGILAVADVARLKKSPHTLVTGVLLANLNHRTSRRTAGSADFNIATGLKWAPLRYTHPVGSGVAGAVDCSGDDSSISCTGDPHARALYGWQTTTLDAYVGYFFHPQTGAILSLDLGYSANAPGAELSAVRTLADYPFAGGAPGFTLANPGPGAASLFTFFQRLSTETAPAAPTVGPLSVCVFITNNGSTSTENVHGRAAGTAGDRGTVLFDGPGLKQTNQIQMDANGSFTTPFTVGSFGMSTITTTITLPSGQLLTNTTNFTLNAANDTTSSGCN